MKQNSNMHKVKIKLSENQENNSVYGSKEFTGNSDGVFTTENFTANKLIKDNISQEAIPGKNDILIKDTLHNPHLEKNKITNLPISEYTKWFDVLVQGNAKLAEEMLNSASSKEEYNKMINCPFDFKDKIRSKTIKIGSKSWRIYLPFHVALSMCSRNIVTLLEQRGVDILAVDHNNCNVLHTCIIAAFYKPEIEDAISSSVTWFLGYINQTNVVKLLNQENKCGFRPVEFAAQQGCLRLMKVLLENNPSITEVVSNGLTEFKYIDVTEYEIGARHSKSPITMLAYLDQNDLDSSKLNDLLLDPLVYTWINSKILSNIIPVIFWLFFRLSLFVVYFILDTDVSYLNTLYGNQTDKYLCPGLSAINIQSNYVKTSMLVFIEVFLILTFIVDFINIVRAQLQKRYQRVKNIKGYKNIIINSMFYTMNNTALLLLILMGASVYHLTLLGVLTPDETITLTVNIARILIPVMVMWSLLYFVQFVPTMAPAIISIQSMNMNLFSFIIIFGIVIVPFVHAFETFTHYFSLDGCVQDFSVPYRSSYTLFLLMLNEYDLTSLNVRYIWVLYGLHVIYIFMVGIMLVNFLIAVMSNKASKIARNETVMVKLNQLALVVKLEDRVMWFSKSFYMYFRRWGFHVENKKVYLLSEFCRLDSLFADKKFD